MVFFNHAWDLLFRTYEDSNNRQTETAIQSHRDRWRLLVLHISNGRRVETEILSTNSIPWFAREIETVSAGRRQTIHHKAGIYLVGGVADTKAELEGRRDVKGRTGIHLVAEQKLVSGANTQSIMRKFSQQLASQMSKRKVQQRVEQEGIV